MSPALTFIVPGRIDTRTGGYEYDRRIVAGLCDRGWDVHVRELDACFPHPTPEALRHADNVLSAIADGTTVVVDGLACGAMPEQVERHGVRLRIVPLVHALLASEIGLDASAAARLAASERRALAPAAVVVAVGRTLIDPLTHYGVARDRIVVVEPGTDAAPLAHGSTNGVVQLVTVATLNPGKGHRVLFEALAALPHANWRLTCAGSTARSPETSEALRTTLTAVRLDGRVTLAGELDAAAIADLYDAADVAVLPTLSETHPLTILEALARGIPIVSTTVGAIPDLVGSGDDAAGVLVAPGDAAALTHALSRVLGDDAFRGRLAAAARRRRERLRTWEQAAAAFEGVLIPTTGSR